MFFLLTQSLICSLSIDKYYHQLIYFVFKRRLYFNLFIKIQYIVLDSEEIKRNSKKMEHVFTLKFVLDDFFGEETQVPDVEELLDIYGRVNTNAFHISHNIENIAVGIYLGPSVLDHSCSPNAIVTFQGIPS